MVGAALLVGPLFDLIKTALAGAGLDPEAKARAQAHAFEVLTAGDFGQRQELQLALAQLRVNEEEAKAPGILKGGWRPFTGWGCSVGLIAQTTIAPLLSWAIEASTGHKMPPLPAMETELILALLVPLLGLGAYRTKEKIEGKA